MRIACLLQPDLPLAARLRVEPELAGAPLAIVDGTGTRAQVVCVTAEARIRAVRPGLTVTQARALCPEVVVRATNTEVERTAEAALRDVGLSFSPRVEKVSRPDALTGAVLLDASGLRRLVGGGEEEIASAMIATGRRLGLDLRAGIAGTRGVARIAARAGVRIVGKGHETVVLAPLPIDTLAFGEFGAAAVTERLRSWGLQTVGDFALLPMRGTFERLGPVGCRLMELARGVDRTPLQPVPPAEVIEESLELDYTIYAVEPLAFLMRGLLDRATERLAARGLAAGTFDLVLELDPRGKDVRQVVIAAPTRDVPSLVRLARLSVEERPPVEPVRGLAVRIAGQPVREEQMSLFGPRAPSPERLATTLARLSALVGPDRVGTPEVVDSHHPAAFAMAPFAPPPIDEAPPSRPATRSLARRMLRPPRPAEVFCQRARPTYVRAEGMGGGRVVHVAGPWRVRMDWWKKEIHRDDWDVILSDGGIYRIFHDLNADAWFVDARYD